jgi:hypothetical protein
MSSSHGSRFWGVLLTLAITGMGLGFLFGLMDQSRFINNGMPIFVGLVGGGVFWAVVRGPIGKAVAKMLDGHSVPDEQLVMRIEQLEDRLAELGMDQLRVAELEERLDFAERLLSQREPAGALRKPEN